ncbi:MAG: metal ABC transporter substrate-binding protein [Candidatus Calescibacterium sp.]|nr:metal ABC transporter substrate-binding protein [Candidatus Calescibacterium sp.]MDW8133272.1 metal ABC transporter substrate-binding protein [Candidatus Calescibacterium sp.]
MIVFFRKGSFKILVFIFLLLFIASSKNLVTFSINPLMGFYKDLVGNGKNKWEYNVLLGSSFDHHHFDIRPGDIKKIKDSKFLVFIGTLELEREVMKMVKNKEKIVLTDYLEVYDGDPHVWVSVKNSKKIVQVIYNYLYSKMDKKELYQNYRNLYKKYDEIDKRFTILFSKKDLPIFSYHNEFGYISRDYGIKINSLFEHEEDISPKHLKEMIKKLRSYGNRKVYIILPPHYDEKVVNYIKNNSKNVEFIVFNSNSVNLYDEFVKLMSLK